MRHSLLNLRTVLLFLALPVLGCWDDPEAGQHRLIEDEEDDPGVARLEVDPAALQFGPVCAGTSASRTVTLRNTGDGVAALNNIALEGSGNEAFSIVESEELVTLAPSSSIEFTVEFAPSVDAEVTGTLTFVPDSELVEAAVVQLSGSLGGPELAASSDTADFGPVAVAETAELVMRLSSVGERPLTITKVSLDSLMDADELWIADLSVATFPVSLGSGEFVDVTLAMRPDAYQPFSLDPLGSLTVESSDCVDSSVELPVLGWPGGVASECVPLVEEGQVGKEISDVDVLFVVDNSASMAEEQTALAEHFAEFVAYADGLAIDYQIGVTTTDVPNDAGTLQGTTPLIEPGLTQAFLTNVQVGTSGSDSEKGLEASLLALEGTTPDTFGPYRRPDANLAVIYVSDDDDHSSEAVGSILSALNQHMSGMTGTLAAHALVAMPPGCSEETENYGLRYMETAIATGGTSTSICDTDFEAAFSDIGVACFGDAATFHLEQAAKPETLEVLVNGVTCDGSWTLSPDVSSIVFDFDSECFPAPGVPVVIRYVPLCWPEDTPMGWMD